MVRSLDEGDTSVAFAIRHLGELEMRFSLGASKRDEEGVEVATAATPSSSLDSSSCSSPDRYSSRITNALDFLLMETLLSWFLLGENLV